jgi:hypothetical protein
VVKPFPPLKPLWRDSQLLSSRLGLVPVVLGVRLGCFFRMMRGMVLMALRGVRVVRSRLMIACFVVLGRLAMVPGRALVMLRRFQMVLRCLL